MIDKKLNMKWCRIQLYLCDSIPTRLQLRSALVVTCRFWPFPVAGSSPRCREEFFCTALTSGAWITPHWKTVNESWRKSDGCAYRLRHTNFSVTWHLAILYYLYQAFILPWDLLLLWDFYFCALGSLVVLSFSQLVSFSSVFPKPLSETLTSVGTAGCSTGQQLWPLSAD
jgi:hypothetical protein